MVDYSVWQSCEHDDEPRDQQIDLAAGYWAEVGPDERHEPGGWSWTILRGGSDEIDGSFAADETAAKAAVADWAAANLPGQL